MFESMHEFYILMRFIFNIYIHMYLMWIVTDKKGKYPAHIASASANLDALQLLIANGADLSKCDKFGRTCLHWAAMLNHLNCVKELLKAGAEVVYDGNWQPLHEAAKAGHNEIIQVLLDAGCDVKNPSKCM